MTPDVCSYLSRMPKRSMSLSTRSSCQWTSHLKTAILMSIGGGNYYSPTTHLRRESGGVLNSLRDISSDNTTSSNQKGCLCSCSFATTPSAPPNWVFTFHLAMTGPVSTWSTASSKGLYIIHHQLSNLNRVTCGITPTAPWQLLPGFGTSIPPSPAARLQ